MSNPKIWYVSYDNTMARRRCVRNAAAFENESEAKQFAKEALETGKLVYAGTLNPYKPRRFIPPAKVRDWINAI